MQLRARDGDGEVICTATEPFSITADTTSKVDLVLICDISFQAPVGMLDVDGAFSFNVGNFCPDLFVLNCLDSFPPETFFFPPPNPPVAATTCEVRFRDGDSTCGQNCDPQSCAPDPTGLVCTPGPDPGVSTTVTCVNGQIDCDGNPATTETSCTFAGDTTGTIGGLEGVFNVACIPPALGGIPGAVVTCTAVTTDGDLDCDKTKVVSIFCIGDAGPCDPSSIPPPPDCSDAANPDGNDCTSEVCDASSGTAVCVFSTNVPAGGGANCTTCPGAPAVLCTCDGAGICSSFCCVTDADCVTDGNECTVPPVGACDSLACLCLAEVNEVDNTPCAGGTGSCQAGVCVDNCGATSCDDGNECTDDVCDPAGQGGAACSDNGPCCSNTNDDNKSCNTCPQVGAALCECFAGICQILEPCPPPPIVGQAQTACRNSFNQLLSQFPVDYAIQFDDCAFPGQTFNVEVTPTLNIEQGFLQVAAETLCPVGIDICTLGASFTDVQVQVEALTGATCTGQLSELAGTPVTLPLTCSAGCPAPVVTAPVAIALPTVALACTAGPAPGPVGICATGTTPLFAAFAPTGTQDVDTWAEVDIGLPNPVSFQCGDALVSAADPCTVDADCPTGSAGETPFPSATCDLSSPPDPPATEPGTCTTVPLALDPTVDCVTFPVEP